MDMFNYFLFELKDHGPLVIRHVTGDENEADVITNNTATSVFKNTFISLLRKTCTWLGR